MTQTELKALADGTVAAPATKGYKQVLPVVQADGSIIRVDVYESPKGFGYTVTVETKTGKEYAVDAGPESRGFGWRTKVAAPVIA